MYYNKLFFSVCEYCMFAKSKNICFSLIELWLTLCTCCYSKIYLLNHECRPCFYTHLGILFNHVVGLVLIHTYTAGIPVESWCWLSTLTIDWFPIWSCFVLSINTKLGFLLHLVGLEYIHTMFPVKSCRFRIYTQLGFLLIHDLGPFQMQNWVSWLIMI